VYATGVGYTRWWGEDAQSIQLLPDRQEYHVGDTAQVFVQTPLPDGEYLMAVEREGISDHRIIQIAGSQTVLEVPITDEHVPVIYLTLSTTSERQETPKSYFEPDLGKPKGYFGVAQLFVNPDTRRFDIEILPEQPSYKPGEQATVQLRVTKDGRPLEAAEVTLMAVDRGVVDLINYRVPDPVAFFYDPSRFPLGVRGADSRSLLIDPVTYEVKNLQGGDSGGEKLDERKDFRPTAYFEPYLVSDENGLIEVQMDLPDSLTTYRLTAVGVKDDTFSLREHELLVSNPITMRASLPRLMRERDTAFTGVVVTNLTGDPQDVKVSLAIQGEGLILDSAFELDQVINPGKSLEFPFQVAAIQEGEVDLIFTLESDQGIRDRLRTSLEIQRPLTPETTSVFGTLTGDSQEAVALPSAAAQGFGELRIQIHGTRLFQIAKPVARLHEIWYAGLSSQILKTTPSMILGQGLQTLIGRRPLSEASITGLIRTMAQLQHPDGGFVEIPGSMDRIQESSPWSTLRAANFLADYADSRALDTSAPDLSGTSLSTLDMVALENRLRAMVQDTRLDAPTKAYAYYLQARLFGADSSSGAKLLALGDGLGMDGLGFVALAGLLGGQDPLEAESVAKTARSRMMNFVNISPRGVDFLQTYETRSYFDSPARRLALLYQLLSILDPGSDHLDRIAHTMVREVSRGQWRSYDDLLWTLTTLAPSNPARQLAGESNNQVEDQVDSPSGNQIGQTSAQVSTQFSELTLIDAQSVELLGEPISAVFPLYEGILADLPRNTLLPLRFISEEGDPPVQYSATLTYALPDEVITARDEGIGVVTWVERTDGTRLPWKELERGETYRMVVNLETPSRYYNLALRIPLPSGAEILDSSLTTTGRYAGDGGVDQRDWTRETEYGDSTTYVDEGYMGRNSGGWWFSSIRPEKRIYDGEVHYYFGSVYEGSQTVSFLFRAVTPGIYPLAPARAELMDEPEVFGRSGGELAIIK
jgi:uncharacterized protein YfaS (alpha-2-macroglobulin family)